MPRCDDGAAEDSFLKSTPPFPRFCFTASSFGDAKHEKQPIRNQKNPDKFTPKPTNCGQARPRQQLSEMLDRSRRRRTKPRRSIRSRARDKWNDSSGREAENGAKLERDFTSRKIKLERERERRQQRLGGKEIVAIK